MVLKQFGQRHLSLVPASHTYRPQFVFRENVLLKQLLRSTLGATVRCPLTVRLAGHVHPGRKKKRMLVEIFVKLQVF